MVTLLGAVWHPRLAGNIFDATDAPTLGRTEKQLTGGLIAPYATPRARRRTHHPRSYRLRRLGPSLVDRNRATSSTATKSRHDPSLALPATQTRCFADHRQAVGVLHDVGGAEHIWLATDSHLREWNPCQPLMISRRVADYPDPLTGCSSVRRSSVTRAFTHLLTPPPLLSYPLLAPQQTSLGPSKIANLPTPTTGQNAV